MVLADAPRSQPMEDRAAGALVPPPTCRGARRGGGLHRAAVLGRPGSGRPGARPWCCWPTCCRRCCRTAAGGPDRPDEPAAAIVADVIRAAAFAGLVFVDGMVALVGLVLFARARIALSVPRPTRRAGARRAERLAAATVCRRRPRDRLPAGPVLAAALLARLRRGLSSAPAAITFALRAADPSAGPCRTSAAAGR